MNRTCDGHRSLSVPRSTSLCVSGNENTDVAMVPAHVLGDLSEVLINRLDQLLDRLTDRPTDRTLAAPTPGSAVWESEWNDSETETGRGSHAHGSEQN